MQVGDFKRGDVVMIKKNVFGFDFQYAHIGVVLSNKAKLFPIVVALEEAHYRKNKGFHFLPSELANLGRL